MNIALYNASPPLLSLRNSGHIAKLLARSFDRRGDGNITCVLQHLKIRRGYQQSSSHAAEEMMAIERVERPMIRHCH
jgi:hypothetical protein